MRVVAAAVLLSVACTGEIFTPPANPVGKPLPPIVVHETPLPPFAPAPAGLKRLTRAQYIATVNQVLGPAPFTIPPLEPDTRSYHFASIGASDTSIGASSAELYDTAAFAIAAQVAARRSAFALPCTGPAQSVACVTGFVAKYGRLLWRRPLDHAERARFVGLIRAGEAAFGDVWRGYERAIAAMLTSPFFLYRVELADAGHYSGPELATRLAFFLWGSTPDEALLDAGESGALLTDKGLEAQVDRLLASPRARASLMTFFQEHFTLDRLDGLQKPAFAQSSPTLGAAMKREVELTIDDVVFAQRKDMRRLFDTDVGFYNTELARFYGYPLTGQEWTRLTRPPTDPRAGVLSSAGFLSMASGQLESSPTLRGKFLKLSVLCEEIPPPPMGVVTELPPAQPGETTRQRSDRHQAVPQCAGCHARMDPLGYALEGFDAIGAFRSTDNGKPVNAVTKIGAVTIDGAKELATLLASHQRVGPCLARELYRYATGHVNLEGEDVVLFDVSTQFAAGGFRFEALARAIVLSDGFRQAGEPR